MDSFLSTVPPRPENGPRIDWHTENNNKPVIHITQQSQKKPLSTGIVSLISFVFGIALFGVLLWLITFLQGTKLGSFMAKASQKTKTTIMQPGTTGDILCPNGSLNAVSRTPQQWTLECIESSEK